MAVFTSEVVNSSLRGQAIGKERWKEEIAWTSWRMEKSTRTCEDGLPCILILVAFNLVEAVLTAESDQQVELELITHLNYKTAAISLSPFKSHRGILSMAHSKWNIQERKERPLSISMSSPSRHCNCHFN